MYVRFLSLEKRTKSGIAGSYDEDMLKLNGQTLSEQPYILHPFPPAICESD